jgi:hypothetical protein
MPRYVNGLDQVKEACRDMRTLRPVEEFLGARLVCIAADRRDPFTHEL